MASASVVSLPTRNQRDDSIKRKQTKSACDILVQMGFPKQRAEKAVAATGDRGVELASDWLLSHVNDPSLDKTLPREYILYLCPVGPLQKQLSNFWEKSLSQVGWNGAHFYFPHITLSPFFKADDNKVSALSTAMMKLDNKLHQAPGKLELDFFSQTNFIGLFVRDQTYFQYLTDLTSTFASDVKKAGIQLEPHKKQLHITLAYQYQPDQHEKLVKLAKEINLSADVRWELRLYSRDSRMGQNEVRQVIKRYTPQLGDELELIDGDFIFMDPQEVNKSKDSWYQGTSWLTGCAGMFPGPYTRRTAETWTWALHRNLVIHEKTSAPNKASLNGNLIQLEDEVDGEAYDNISHDDKMYALVRKRRNSEAMVADRVLEPRKLYILRHGERIDFALGRDWFDKCYDDSGKYTRTNLNLPKSMITRKTQYEYIKDPPLSEIGRHQCKITAEYLYEKNVMLNYIYTSPSLRCIQTAMEIYNTFRMTCKLRIEPGLFEWTGHRGVPRWITPEDLAKQGYPVDLTYKPQIPNNKLDDEETVKELYSRTTQATKNILSLHELEGGNILFVGHAGTLELCTRVLTGSTVRSEVQYLEILPKVPYCSMCMIEEDQRSKRWFFKDIPIHQFTHGRNTGQAIKDILKS